MADRYWILGTGTWDATTTTNWSTSSGGGGGASVPTAADNVFFDANSNVLATDFTVTMATTRVCNNFTASGLDGVMTLAGGFGIGLTVSGSLTFQATNFTRTYSGTTTFNATSTGKTVTTNGVSLGGATSTVSFDGVGGGWSLGSALTCGTLEILNGTFDTSSSGNYAVTASTFSSSNSSVRTIKLNASTVTLSNNGTPWSMGTSTNATLNAGTSTINITSSSSPTFAGGGLTYYNVAYTSANLIGSTITGTNTFYTLSTTNKTSPSITPITLSASQTISGTLTIGTGTASAYRTMIRSSVIGTTRTLTCASIAAMSDVDFRDITIAGAHGTLSGTRLGDCKGNSNITFPAAKTVYYRQTGSSTWESSGSGSWSATSGGALDATMFPLAQDTAVFPAATYPASGSTVTIFDQFNIGTIDMSLRTTNTITFTISTQPTIYGNWINGTGTTLSGTSTITFAGRTTQQITSSAKTFTQAIDINSPSGTVQLQDALTTGTGVTTTLTFGTLNLNGFTYTVGTRFTTATGTKNLTFNGGTLVCPNANTTSFNNAVPTGFTTTAGTGTGTISMTAATAKTFVGGGSTYNCTLNQGGAGTLTITGSNTFLNITNTRKSVSATSILFTAGTTSTFTDWNASGESTRLLTIGSVTAASHTLSKASGTVSADFLSISRSTATGGAGWYAGANSTNGGNNSGWIFTAPPAPTATGNFLVFF